MGVAEAKQRWTRRLFQLTRCDPTLSTRAVTRQGAGTCAMASDKKTLLSVGLGLTILT